MASAGPTIPGWEASSGTTVPIGALTRSWWALLLRGVLAIAFGILVWAMPAAALGSFVLLFAAYMLADGVLAIASAIRAGRAHRRWGWFVLEAVLDIAAGVIALWMPSAALFTFVLLAAFWAMLSGVALLVAAFGTHREHGRWWVGAAGAISLLWGVLILIAPMAGLLALTLWVGSYAFVFGIVLCVLAVKLRRRHLAHAAS